MGDVCGAAAADAVILRPTALSWSVPRPELFAVSSRLNWIARLSAAPKFVASTCDLTRCCTAFTACAWINPFGNDPHAADGHFTLLCRSGGAGKARTASFFPPGLEELCLEQIPHMWEATPDAHARSLRKLVLSLSCMLGDDHRDDLGAAKLATLTALESLRADTPDVHAALAGAAPALSRLTRLVGMPLGDGTDAKNPTKLDANDPSRQRRMLLSLLMQQLSALPALRHLEISDVNWSGAQTLDRKSVIPTLEVLHLEVLVQANSQFLAFFEEPGRLAAVHVSDMTLESQPRFETLPDFRLAMSQCIPAYVIVTVEQWSEQ